VRIASFGVTEHETNAELEMRFLRLLEGKWVTAAVSAAASLGLAKALEQPQTLEALSQTLGCDNTALERLLAVLRAQGLVTHAQEKYALTPLGQMLREDELGTLSAFVGAPFSWNPWSVLEHAVRRGKSAFEVHHAQPLFEYIEERPEEAKVYHAAVDAFTRRQARALAKSFDFSTLRCIADVGGGPGTLLIEVLRQFEHLQGVLIDRAPAVALAERAFIEAGVADRCCAKVADFFQPLQVDADVCIVKHVIHNWDDARACTILANCAAAVGKTGQVLVIEGLLLPGDHPDMTRLVDLEMLALCGPGRERGKPEMRRLLKSAGLHLNATLPLTGMTRLMVCDVRA